MVRIISNSAEETEKAGERLAELLHGNEVIALFGGLGMGKTAFTRGLARGLGVNDGVSSPTFALVNEYHAPGCVSVYHFDMYRVTSPEALETTGFWDYPLEDAVFVIEWAENIAEELPEPLLLYPEEDLPFGSGP